MPSMIKLVCKTCHQAKRLGNRSHYTAKERYCVACHTVSFEREPNYCRIYLRKQGASYYHLVRIETNIDGRRGRVVVTTWSGTAARGTYVYAGGYLNRHQAHQLTQDTTNTVIGLQPEDQDLPYFYDSSIYDSIHP